MATETLSRARTASWPPPKTFTTPRASTAAISAKLHTPPGPAPSWYKPGKSRGYAQRRQAPSNRQINGTGALTGETSPARQPSRNGQWPAQFSGVDFRLGEPFPLQGQFFERVD